MIRPRRPPGTDAVARHYDELDPLYRAAWGEDLHHGFWRAGDESPREAVRALTEAVAEAAGLGSESGARVCDVGCGYGGPARFLTEHYGCRVLGLTLSAAQQRYAAGRSPGRDGDPRFVTADWLEIPLEPRSFDAVIAIESLSHIADKPAALRKARTVLRPNGRLALAVWMASGSPTPWQRRWLLEPICDEGRLSGLATETEYRTWIAESDLELLGFRDLSAAVRRTWSVSLRRMALLLVRGGEGWRYLRDRRHSERRFALAVGRIWLAYRTGALRYGLLTARAL